MTVDMIFYIWLSLFGAITLIQLSQWIVRLIKIQRSVNLTRFSDYPNKKGVINPDLNKVIFGLAQLIVVAALGMTVVFQFLDFQVYKYYFFLLIPMALGDGSIIFYELTKKRYHFDLEIPDAAYYRIEGIQQNAEQYIQEKNQLVIRLDQFINETKQLLGPLLSGDNSRIFSPVIDELAKNYEAINHKISNLNANIEQLKSSFIAEFKRYLESDTYDFKKMFKDHSVDDTDQDADNEFKAIITKTQKRVQDAIHSFCTINAKINLNESTQLLSILNQFDATIDSALVKTILEKLTIDSNEYLEFNQVFYQSKIDFDAVFTDHIVPNDRAEFFDASLMQIPDRSVIRKIFKSVLTLKAEKSLNRLMMTLDAKVISDIDDLSQLIKVDSDLRYRIQVYAKLTRRLYQSMNPMNQIENITMILKTLEKPLKSTQSVIQKINQQGYTNANYLHDAISQAYKEEIGRIAPLIIDSYELINWIQTQVANDADTLFDFEHLETYVLEAAFKLKPDDILLGMAFALVNVKFYKSQLKELFEEPWKSKLERLLKLLNLDEQGFATQAPQSTFESLIKNNPRFRSQQKILPQIIMRLEKRRLSLDILN